MSQQLAEGLYIATRLQTGRCKGVVQRMRAHLPDSRLFQIYLDAFPVAAGFGGLGVATRQKPCRITGVSAQLFQHNKQLFRNWNFPARRAGFRRLDDHLCMAVSAGNSADRSADFQRAEFQVKVAPLQAADLANAQTQFQPQQ